MALIGLVEEELVHRTARRVGFRPANPASRPGDDVGPDAARCGEQGYHAALLAFASIAEALSEGRDLDTILHLVGMQICKLAGVQRASIYLRDPETGLFRGQVGHPDAVGDERIKRLVAGMPADRFTQEIVESQRPVAIVNAMDDPRPIRSTMRAWHIRSMLGVPMVLRGEVIGIMFVDNEGRTHRFSPSVCEVASTFADLAAIAISQARVTAELRRSLAAVERQNELLRRAAVIDDRLANLVVKGADLSEIAAAVAELTGKPISIHDAEHRRLASAVPPWLDETVLPRLLDASCRDHPAVIEALRGMRATHGGVVGPLPDLGLHHRFLVAPILIREETCGHLVIMEYGSRFNSLELHVARRAATKVALELTIERRGIAAARDASASLTADLICGRLDGASFARRARFIGIDPSAPRVLCLVTGDASVDDAAPAADELSAALAFASRGSGVLTTGVAEGVVALLEVNRATSRLAAISEARMVVEQALDTVGDSRLRAALSSRCTTAPDFVRGYEEARQVMTCLRSFSSDQGARVLAADDLGVGRVLLSSSDHVSVRRFAEDALGDLLAENETARDQLRTLEIFFECGRNIRRSAVVLDVHENTVRYRLTRIERKTGLAVGTSADDQLTAQLALLVLRLDGTLPRPRNGELINAGAGERPPNAGSSCASV